MSKTGIIGDLHFKEHLGYYDHVEDSRESEFNEILDFIVESLKDCDKIVFLGDNFDKKNNQAIIVKRFLSFVERFSGKSLYFLAGNHEKDSFGRTALDFLSEIKDKKWNIITRKIESIDGLILVPFFSPRELGLKNVKDATKYIMSSIKQHGKGMVFCHTSLGGAKLASLIDASVLNEVVLPVDELENEAPVFAGHIHLNQKIKDGVYVVGSVFNNDVTDVGKKIYKVDENYKIEEIDLPGRKIIKIENPTVEALSSIDKGNIIKAVFTKKVNTEEVLKELETFDGHLVIRDFSVKRKKSSSTIDVSEMSVEQLTKMYCVNNKIDFLKIQKAFDLIKK